MSVSNTTRRVQYNGDGSTTAFTFAFPLPNNDTTTLTVVLTDTNGVDTTQTVTTQYTVAATNNDFSSGGTVTMITAPASGEELTIFRDVPDTQTTDFQRGGNLDAETLEDTLDKLTMLFQELKETVDRTVKLPITDTDTTPSDLPKASTRANAGLIFDATGDVAVGATPSASVSPFMQTVVDDATASAARLTLGAQSLVAMTAGTALTAGDLAGISPDGTLKNRVGMEAFAAVDVPLSSGTDTDTVDVCPVTGDTFAVAWSIGGAGGDGEIAIGTIGSDGTITYGAASIFEAAECSSIGIAKLDSTHVIITWFDVTNTEYEARVAVISGTTISSFGTALALPDSNTTVVVDTLRPTALSATLFVVAYPELTSADPTVVAGSISGSTITFGTNQNLAATAIDADEGTYAVAMSATSFIAYRIVPAGNELSVTGATVSGTTITLGTEVQAADAVLGGSAIVSLSSTRAVLAVSADILTLETQILSLSGSTVTVDISTRRNVKFGVRHATGAFGITKLNERYFAVHSLPVFQGSTPSVSEIDLIRVDHKSCMLVSTVLLSHPGIANNTKLTKVNDERCVAATQPSGTNEARCSTVDIMPMIAGLAQTTVASSATVALIRDGLSDVHTGLTAGSHYFSDNDGNLSTDPLGIPVGMAISATEILLDIEGHV